MVSKYNVRVDRGFRCTWFEIQADDIQEAWKRAYARVAIMREVFHTVSVSPV